MLIVMRFISLLLIACALSTCSAQAQVASSVPADQTPPTRKQPCPDLSPQRFDQIGLPDDIKAILGRRYRYDLELIRQSKSFVFPALTSWVTRVGLHRNKQLHMRMGLVYCDESILDVVCMYSAGNTEAAVDDAQADQCRPIHTVAVTHKDKSYLINFTVEGQYAKPYTAIALPQGSISSLIEPSTCRFLRIPKTEDDAIKYDKQTDELNQIKEQISIWVIYSQKPFVRHRGVEGSKVVGLIEWASSDSEGRQTAALKIRPLKGVYMACD